MHYIIINIIIVATRTIIIVLASHMVKNLNHKMKNLSLYVYYLCNNLDCSEKSIYMNPYVFILIGITEYNAYLQKFQQLLGTELLLDFNRCHFWSREEFSSVEFLNLMISAR